MVERINRTNRPAGSEGAEHAMLGYDNPLPGRAFFEVSMTAIAIRNKIYAQLDRAEAVDLTKPISDDPNEAPYIMDATIAAGVQQALRDCRHWYESRSDELVLAYQRTPIENGGHSGTVAWAAHGLMRGTIIAAQTIDRAGRAFGGEGDE